MQYPEACISPSPVEGGPVSIGSSNPECPFSRCQRRFQRPGRVPVLARVVFERILEAALVTQLEPFVSGLEADEDRRRRVVTQGGLQVGGRQNDDISPLPFSQERCH